MNVFGLIAEFSASAVVILVVFWVILFFGEPRAMRDALEPSDGYVAVVGIFVFIFLASVSAASIQCFLDSL